MRCVQLSQLRAGAADIAAGIVDYPRAVEFPRHAVVVGNDEAKRFVVVGNGRDDPAVVERAQIVPVARNFGERFKPRPSLPVVGRPKPPAVQQRARFGLHQRTGKKLRIAEGRNLVGRGIITDQAHARGKHPIVGRALPNRVAEVPFLMVFERQSPRRRPGAAVIAAGDIAGPASFLIILGIQPGAPSEMNPAIAERGQRARIRQHPADVGDGA